MPWLGRRMSWRKRGKPLHLPAVRSKVLLLLLPRAAPRAVRAKVALAQPSPSLPSHLGSEDVPWGWVGEGFLSGKRGWVGVVPLEVGPLVVLAPGRRGEERGEERPWKGSCSAVNMGGEGEGEGGKGQRVLTKGED